MKKILFVVAAFSMASVAFANPCPEGNNSRLGDRTNPGASGNTQLLNNAGATSGVSGRALGASLRNHFQH
jgi:hypothetical protein